MTRATTAIRSSLALVLGFLLLLGGAVPQPAAAIETAAKQALLIDLTTGAVLLEKDADTSMPPASMSKIMTVYMVFERLRDGRLSLEDTFPVSKKAWQKGGSKMFVEVNKRVAVEDLLRGIIVQSGNDASIVIAEGLAGSEERFAEDMTRRAHELGLAGSSFKNATGWPEEGHVMTARDLALLAELTIREFPEYYRYYAETSFTFSGIEQPNRNPLLGRVKGADGLKTGHTKISGYGLTASAERDGRRLILVLNGLDSSKQRARESERLIEWGFREFDAYALFKAGEVVESARVWLGEAGEVPLVIESDLVRTLPRRSRDGLKVTVVYEGPVPAPIEKGTRLATLVVSAPETETVEVPLVAGADVARLGPFGRIAAAFKYLLWGAN